MADVQSFASSGDEALARCKLYRLHSFPPVTSIRFSITHHVRVLPNIGQNLSLFGLSPGLNALFGSANGSQGSSSYHFHRQCSVFLKRCLRWGCCHITLAPKVGTIRPPQTVLHVMLEIDISVEMGNTGMLTCRVCCSPFTPI